MANSFEAKDNVKADTSSLGAHESSPHSELPRFRLRLWWRRLTLRVVARLQVSLQQSLTYGRPNMLYFALLELIGQPIYYVLWQYVYPQPYESVCLRFLCVVFALPMLFEARISNIPKLERWLPMYWWLCLIFELPFFFCFMLLMNNLSAVWTLSGLAALMILVILVFDWLMSTLLVAFGSLFATLLYLSIGGDLIVSGEIPLPVVIAIYLFGLIVGSAMNYKAELVAREKMAAITDAVGTAAHELRTPLLGIRSGARGLNDYLPALMGGYELARAHGLPVQPIRRARFQQVNAVLARIQSESEYAGTVLDMLLINSSRASIDHSAFESQSMSACIQAAMDRYPFHSLRQRQWILCELENDFLFHGSQLLMVHVLFNLIKNAIYHLEQAGRSKIRLWMTGDSSRGLNELHFLDNGPGIPVDVLPRIFERFYSGMPRGQGTGIGLAFVQLVMHSFGGHIRCESVAGEYTEFIMTFPEVRSGDD